MAMGRQEHHRDRHVRIYLSCFATRLFVLFSLSVAWFTDPVRSSSSAFCCVIMVFCTSFEGAPKMILRQFTQKPSLRAYSISAWRSHDYQMRMRQCTSATETSTRASVRPNIARTSGTAGCVALQRCGRVRRCGECSGRQQQSKAEQRHSGKTLHVSKDAAERLEVLPHSAVPRPACVRVR